MESAQNLPSAFFFSVSPKKKKIKVARICFSTGRINGNDDDLTFLFLSLSLSLFGTGENHRGRGRKKDFFFDLREGF